MTFKVEDLKKRSNSELRGIVMNLQEHKKDLIKELNKIADRKYADDVKEGLEEMLARRKM
jgi:hypothetical protein